MKQTSRPESGSPRRTPAAHDTQGVGGGSYVLGWVDTALALEEENRELRALMTNVLLAILRNRELVEYARGELSALPIGIAA